MIRNGLTTALITACLSGLVAMGQQADVLKEKSQSTETFQNKLAKKPITFEAKLAEAVKFWISGSFKSDHIESIDIGSFQCVGENNEIANQASGGMEITRRLKDAFEQNQFRVTAESQFIIRGKYQLKKDKTSGEYLLAVALELMKKMNFQNYEHYQLEIDIKTPDLIAKLSGLSGNISGANNTQRVAALTRAIDAPRPPDGNAGSVVKPTATSPFGIEILVKNPASGQYMARGTRIQGGQPFIQLNKGDIYSVRLYNNSKEAAAVELVLDGLGTLALNENVHLREGRYIILPGESAEIKGWSVNNEPEGAHEFTIGSIDKAIAAQHLPQERIKIGLISATFARAWDAANPPEDVKRQPVLKASPDDVANVLGNRIEQQLQQVNYEFGHAAEIVSIRYSSQPPADLPGK